jgi:hypothetical protein
MGMTNRKKNNSKTAASKQDCSYTSLEEWEADNFPSQVKREAQKELEKDPRALGSAIADLVFQEVGADLLSKG